VSQFSIHIEIQAPPERVWAVMSDIEHWHEWTASITRIRRLEGGPLGVGRRAYVSQPKLPPALWKVTEWSEGRGFTWVSRGPGLRVTGRHYVEPAVTGSKVELSIIYEGFFGPLLARMIGSLNGRYLALEANGLKKRSEA
jgi:hypothetical protein